MAHSNDSHDVPVSPTTPEYQQPWMLLNVSNHSGDQLVALTSQCPIMTQLVSHLSPHDLVNIAFTCQSIETTLGLSEPNSQANLQSKTACPRRGVAHRKGLANRQSKEATKVENEFVTIIVCDSEPGVE